MKKQLLIVIVAMTTLLNIGCKNVAPYAIDDPSKAIAVDWVVGKWADDKKTASEDGYFVVSKLPSPKNHYHFVSHDKDKKAPKIESDMFFSKIGDSYFINIPNMDDKKVQNGYFFMRILNAKPPYNMISITTIEDTTMTELKSSDAVRAFITKNLDNPVFYKDTGNLVKMK